MSQADKIRDKVRSRALGGSTPAVPADPTEEQPERRPDRAPVRSNAGRKVRRTVDLGPAHHRELGAWCDRAADELDVTRVTGQDVLSALVARLLTDDRLSEDLVNDLRANQ